MGGAERGVCLEHSGICVAIKDLTDRQDKMEKTVDDIKWIVAKGIGAMIILGAILPLLFELGLHRGWFG